MSLRRACLDQARNLLRAPFLERALVKRSSGAEFGSVIARVVPGHLLYPRPSLREVERHGLQYRLDISDLIDWAIYFDFAEPSLETLFSLAHEGDLVLDVGANIGSTALRLGRKVGPSGTVYAFEPDPSSHARCAHHVALNRAANVKLEALALGDEPGTLRVHRVESRNPGMNRVAKEGNGEAVAVTTLDTFVAERALPRVQLVKIDVEGFEEKVLRGAEQTIRRWMPTLFVELVDDNLRQAGSSPGAVLELLHGWGYDTRDASTGALLLPEDNLTGCHLDVVAKRA